MGGSEAVWSQAYNPLNNPALSTMLAAVPVLVLLGGLAILHIQAHWAAILALASALLIAVAGFGMPAGKAATTAAFGAAYGLLPIGWIILNIIFMYTLTSERGFFSTLKDSLTGVTRDRRLQLVLIAFCFGAFFEGAAGFGTPVAVTAAMLIGLGFRPLQASGLTLIANTAPVAFGALGTPIIVLNKVTDLDLLKLSAMVGRQLPFFSVVVPFWLVAAFAGLRGTLEIWPALLVVGLSFAVPQFVMSNFHGPWLVDVVASVCSMGALVLLLRVWRPRRTWSGEQSGVPDPEAPLPHYTGRELTAAWMPWVILSLLVFAWGLPQVKPLLDGISARLTVLEVPVPGLHRLVQRMPPVVPGPELEKAVFNLNWLSTTGTGIFLAGILSGLLMGYRPREIARLYGATIVRVRYSLLTVTAMLSLGYVTRYSGLDATLGLAFAKTGVLYPFFGTLLGWLGVALTGSDTSSNVLFGSLQKISAAHIGISAILMAAANSAGGVMGKMIDAQSIVVASTATRWYGHEGDILRFVFWHSLALAGLVGLLVFLQAYVWPFSMLVVQ
jgi:lactate permease